MEKYNEEIIKETRELILKDEYGLSAIINGLEVWFGEEEKEEVSNEMIAFALDIVNEYQSNKEKFDVKALEEVKSCMSVDEKVDDLIILNQLGTPIINVATKFGASLMYGGVEEIGNHMPEVILNRNIDVEEVALNG